MRPLHLDKIASVTRNCALDRDVRVGDEYPCREGDVIAVRILSRKGTYNQLELVSGRFSNLKPGDTVAGALGHRRALQGYAGHIPSEIKTGDTLQMLNMGGVIGVCTSFSPEVGPPFECEVLGQVLSFPFLGQRVGEPANIGRQAGALREKIAGGIPPVLAIVGTCMNSGKTAACASLIQEFARQGLQVAAAKVTGVSLMRDTLAMVDAGARTAASFTELGIVTTQRSNAASITRTLLAQLAEGSPDLIVLELGDGLMGDYGVDAILEAADIKATVGALVLAASDPVGAWGGVKLLQDRFGYPVAAITGPCTDNSAGVDNVEAATGCVALNARLESEALAAHLMKTLGLGAGVGS